jgi:DNA repair exonuclease SbcCD ATPase subunit
LKTSKQSDDERASKAMVSWEIPISYGNKFEFLKFLQKLRSACTDHQSKCDALVKRVESARRANQFVVVGGHEFTKPNELVNNLATSVDELLMSIENAKKLDDFMKLLNQLQLDISQANDRVKAAENELQNADSSVEKYKTELAAVQPLGSELNAYNNDLQVYAGLANQWATYKDVPNTLQELTEQLKDVRGRHQTTVTQLNERVRKLNEFWPMHDRVDKELQSIEKHLNALKGGDVAELQTIGPALNNVKQQISTLSALVGDMPLRQPNEAVAVLSARISALQQKMVDQQRVFEQHEAFKQQLNNLDASIDKLAVYCQLVQTDLNQDNIVDDECRNLFTQHRQQFEDPASNWRKDYSTLLTKIEELQNQPDADTKSVNAKAAALKDRADKLSQQVQERITLVDKFIVDCDKTSGEIGEVEQLIKSSHAGDHLRANEIKSVRKHKT